MFIVAKTIAIGLWDIKTKTVLGAIVVFSIESALGSGGEESSKTKVGSGVEVEKQEDKAFGIGQAVLK